MKMKPKTLVIALGVIAGVSVIGNIFLAIRDNSSSIGKYPYLDPAEEIYNNSDLLVNMHPLAMQLQALVNNSPNIEIYFQFLNTGSDIRINTTPFYPGSLMKVPVAMAVMKKIETQKWTMDNKLVLTDADKNPAYGTLYQLPTGTEFTVKDLLNDLLVQSDDTARAVFVRNLGEQNIEDVLDYLGLQDVFNTGLQVTAQRYSNFWRALYTASYLSPGSSQQLLSVMALPHDQDLLAAGIAPNVTFSHKIGVYGDTYSDSGIVYIPGRPYLLTVMVRSSSTDEVHEMMKDISRDVFEYVTK